jgi:hypothetical protein
MAKPTKATMTMTLLRWSQQVPISDVLDPLGLGLRGSTRIGSELLYCITSITRRARYFSFLPWCVLDAQQRETDKRNDDWLTNAIVVREKALTLGCVASHDGKPCEGGALVGSLKASRWFEKGQSQADFRRLHFAKNPALKIYYRSILNLGFFVTEDELPDLDDEIEERALKSTDLELTPLGLKVAGQYDSLVGKLKSVKSLASSDRKCSVRSLAEIGKKAGLCELANGSAPDRQSLIDVFFARETGGRRSDNQRKLDQFRNRSLLLILSLARQLGSKDWILDEPAFGSAVYFGEIVSDDGDRIEITWPKPLVDIATRWRMFYFHHFMSVALEGMFSWLVGEVGEKGLTGISVKELAARLNAAAARKPLEKLLGTKFPSAYGNLSPAEVLGRFTGGSLELNATVSQRIDDVVLATAAISEDRLEEIIRQRTYLQSAAGLAVPMLLLALTLARFKHWETTDHGQWLGNFCHDGRLDLIPPVVMNALDRQFGQWWTCRWADLAEYVLLKHVVLQHRSMSYEKSVRVDRCLLQWDGSKITAKPNESFEKIGMGNPRFNSAVRILKDLRLLAEEDDEITMITSDGKRLLEEELAKG